MVSQHPKVPTPRCIIVRHGQTEWSNSGQFTGNTDLPLTPHGEELVRLSGKALIEYGFVKPENITYVFTSPRKRARDTVRLMLEKLSDEQRSRIKVIVDDDLHEWDYGDYEGLLTEEIVQLRKSRGLDRDRPWVIWRDGCENGESTKQIGLRCSRAIARIQAIHRVHLEQGIPSDIMVFAHGHLLRYFAALWFGLGIEEPIESVIPSNPSSSYVVDDKVLPNVEMKTFKYLDKNPNLLLDAGGVGVLSYSHNNVDEPAMALAGPFTVR
ncbi:SHB17 (YKR043C) [Zygosaccharomyces parabailii]|nr:SHB17 (YKR043C) [Zygosaccharomyces parabailii]CDH15514.1 probable Sedoheptulose 1,7-bisphosphatase [Zygosaccharomyces bailii ISA1307]SJM85090.1 probable Sedoheptulose 1,7-bisphosphatase [Zygosaccharomyces bailii]